MKKQKIIKAYIDIVRGLTRLTVWVDMEGFHIKTRFLLSGKQWALSEHILVEDRVPGWLEIFKVEGLGVENNFISRVRYFGAHDMLLKSKKYAWSIIIRNEEAHQISDLIRLYFDLNLVR